VVIALHTSIVFLCCAPQLRRDLWFVVLMVVVTVLELMIHPPRPPPPTTLGELTPTISYDILSDIHRSPSPLAASSPAGQSFHSAGYSYAIYN
jgi:hypothetical protein